MYAAAAALNCVGEIWVVCCVQAPVLGLCCVQTGVKKLPAIFACDGRIGSKLVLVITRRTSSEKKKNVFFLSALYTPGMNTCQPMWPSKSLYRDGGLAIPLRLSKR